MAKRKDKKKRTNKIITLIMAVFLVSSIGGIVLFSSFAPNSQKIRLNGGYTATPLQASDGGKVYRVDFKPRQVYFYSLPDETDQYEVSRELKELIRNTPQLVISFNPEQEQLELVDQMRLDITETLTQEGVYVQSGMTKLASSYNLPLVDCNNATQEIPVIILDHGNETAIEEKGNCLKIHTKDFGYFMMRDKILYIHYGIV